MGRKKIVLIGLDGAKPDLVFGKYKNELPNLAGLTDEGAWGVLKSTHPPTTAQAWLAMLSGKDAGEIGFTDFTFRSDYSYGEPEFVSTAKVRVKTLYDSLASQKKRVCLISLPISYPPIALEDGVCISGFTAPSVERKFTHPSSEKKVVEQLVGKLILDASTEEKNYRQLAKKEALERIFEMDRQRFKLTRHYLKQGFDFLLVHLLGTDRIGHLFCRYSDETHVLFERNDEYATAVLDHLKFVDEEVGRVAKQIAGDEDTTLIVASDHGLNPLDGRINLNEWLLQEGFLALREKPAKPVGVQKAAVDWSRTQAWTMGFMGARVYLNVKGRERQGTVEDYESVREDLAGKFQSLRDGKGRPLSVEVFRKEEIFHGPFAKYAPDLFVQMNDYRWSNNALLGYDSLYSYNTTLGVDDGVHAMNGLFVAKGNGVPHLKLENARIFDVAPTLYRHFGLEIDSRNLQGRELY